MVEGADPGRRRGRERGPQRLPAPVAHPAGRRCVCALVNEKKHLDEAMAILKGSR
ncbi:MAG: hypothetical protein MZU91_06800 [Desulfosudis oleivorans]|nr:hypothetical protein [Desulfosudis oleivorans]